MTDIRERTDAYILARHQHPAWQLLAARRAPLVLSCLQTLFEGSQNGIEFEDTLQALSALLAQHANHPDFDVGTDDPVSLARRELREWIRRALIVEREGKIYATDALEEALRFVASLGDRVMTSTASRLSVVQHEIERVEEGLNPDPKSRAIRLRRQIEDLEEQLRQAETGHVLVLKEGAAIERIREIYTLATSLRADFRRVEDSWREADRTLRQSIVSEQSHRGEIVDKLLDGHDSLLETPEGKVFHGFQQQLSRTQELTHMRQRLRTILKHPYAQAALSRQQHQELRWLVMRLVQESQTVIQARARIERDVKGFLKTGLAAEHHRVGLLLNELFQHALDVDWSDGSVRRRPSRLPPVALANPNLPLVERLRFKSLDTDPEADLALGQQQGNLNDLGEDFWLSFDGLDREALARRTVEILREAGQPLSLSQLAARLPPTHDLETFTVWLGMALEAGLPLSPEPELIDVQCSDGTLLEFRVPRVELAADAMADIAFDAI